MEKRHITTFFNCRLQLYRQSCWVAVFDCWLLLFVFLIQTTQAIIPSAAPSRPTSSTPRPASNFTREERAQPGATRPTAAFSSIRSKITRQLSKKAVELSAHHKYSHVPRSSKRGLIAIPSSAKYTSDDLALLTDSGSDITWYYNYGATPTRFLESSSLDFVPMLWGSVADGFLDTVLDLINSNHEISYILSFNEPDGCTGGGSCVSPGDAARVWKSQLAPLKKRHPKIKIGVPAVTGSPRGWNWLLDFYQACGGRCQADFVTVHWYGDFAGFQDWLNQTSTLPSILGSDFPSELWVTEFGLPFADLVTTQTFYNESIAYLDSLDTVSHYSYFGSFRSSDSNVGPDAAMLDQQGLLTDIGSWYLGGNASGKIHKAHAKEFAVSSHGSTPSDRGIVITAQMWFDVVID